MEKQQKHLTVFGWIMLAWFCLSAGMLVLGIAGWMSERMSVWLGGMDRDDAFGVIGIFGGCSMVVQGLLSTIVHTDEWFVTCTCLRYLRGC